MRKEQTFRILSLAMMSAVVWCCSNLVVSCASDESGVPSASKEEAAPFRFALSIDGYEDTRGLVSNDMDESVGLFAYVFEDFLQNGRPNFMYDEEMQFNGTEWQTVGTFEQPEQNMLMRFYAYYPFALPGDMLDFEFAQDEYGVKGAPSLFYQVPKDLEDHVDLMAGRSVGDIETNKIRTAGALNIKMSHLLTAVEFQVGRCSENGRVVKIELKRVLDKNTYSLSETEYQVEDPDNPGQFLIDPITQEIKRDTIIDGWGIKTYDGNSDDYSDFVANLNAKVVLTKTKQEGGQTVVIPQPVMNDDNAFLMLPQTLPDGAKLEVTINCGGSDHTLTASMAGMEWVQGKRVTYTLDITSLSKLTIRSQITNWNQHETINGVASDGVTVLMNSEINDWTESVTEMNSDDSRTTP